MNVYCVIVCYNPDAAKVMRTCAELAAGSAQVVLVDNTAASYLPAVAPPNCTIIPLGRNTGIAHAQNVGIRHAQSSGAQIIVFFDQDSTIDRSFLSALISPLESGAAQVVSPVYFDEAAGFELPSVRLNKLGLPKAVYNRDGQAPYLVDLVMSSGTAAARDVFDVVGLLDERFFIDFVDTEWCLRCRSKGIPIYVVPRAVMRHSVGNASIDIRIATLFVHSPIRCYYQMRNCFLLFRTAHIPFLFALRETVAVWVNRLVLLLFVKNRSAYVRAYAAAALDGARGVIGKKPELEEV
jgi:rhamnosyltransferase